MSRDAARIEDLLEQERRLRQELIAQHAQELQQTHAAHNEQLLAEVQRVRDGERAVADRRVSDLLDRLEKADDRHVQTVASLLEQLDETRDKHDQALAEMREAHRSEIRELLNRIQHPARMPTGTQPATMGADPQAGERARRRALFMQTGQVDALKPIDPIVDGAAGEPAE
jgi:vacuolar-type H+-ATPase subunit I/STV1